MAGDTLFARLPGHIRARDAAEGYPLRALLAVAEAEFDTLYGDIATLYDDWFIETCEEWVVPYLGDLLGARRLNPAGGDGFSLRAYVANTLSYRRAKGTAAVIEQLARDVTFYPARVVEFWALLIQSQHVNHVRAGNAQSVDIRAADRAAQVGTPFDPWAHTLEIRPIAGREGRYAIPNIGVSLWRLLAAPLGFAFDDPTDVQGGVTPRAVAAADGRFFLHPAGVDAPLFNRPRGEPEIAHLATEAELPAPLRRFPLRQELVARRAGTADPAGYFGLQPVLQIRLNGATLAPERLFIAHLGEQSGGGWRRPAAQGDVMIDPELGRLSLHPADAALPLEVAYAFGTPGQVGAGPWDRRSAFAAWLTAFAPPDAPLWTASVTRRTGEHTANPDNGGPCLGSLADAIALWNATGNGAGRRGLIVLLDNASYPEALPAVQLAANAGLAIAAAGWPVTLTEAGARRRLPANLAPAARRPYIAADLTTASAGGTLVLDGLMLSGGITVPAGTLASLALHHCTLGATDTGLAAGITVAASAGIASVTVNASVLGPIALAPGVSDLSVSYSIIGEDRTADAGAAVLTNASAIDAAGTDIAVLRSTVFGRITARTADIDGSIIAGRARVARRQAGCVRYSLIPLGSRTASRYRCQPDLALEAVTAALRQASGDPQAQLSDADAAALARTLLPRFTASGYEHPGFAQLHALCPAGIATGGAGRTEMGAFAQLGGPIRLANLRVALGDTLRVGLEAGLFTVT
ncbi:MAG: hypothetical protein BGP12_11550 [Rhodospirillales bacterium 70-18]|nr:hypothetical protein [Rhodospirillales bacterium]OJY68429.1 MAG: hypothetical protein BGP12_11550 [Rhodospirillales bacterium 70-18]